MEQVKNNNNYKREIEQMEQKLNRMESNLHDFYCDVGKAVLETAETEGQKINSLVDDIIKTRKQLVEAKKEIICPKCATYNDPDSNYCKHCGSKLIISDKEEEGEYGTE